MVDLDNIRSLQDYSGMLHAGAVLEWAEQTGRDPQRLGLGDLEEHMKWAGKNDVKYRITGDKQFEMVLSWIHDPEWDNSEAHDLFIQVQNDENF